MNKKSSPKSATKTAPRSKNPDRVDRQLEELQKTVDEVLTASKVSIADEPEKAQKSTPANGSEAVNDRDMLYEAFLAIFATEWTSKPDYKKTLLPKLGLTIGRGQTLRDRAQNAGLIGKKKEGALTYFRRINKP